MWGLSLGLEPLQRLNFKAPVFAIVGDGNLVSSIGGDQNLSTIADTHYFSFIYNEVLDEILFLILIISGIIYAFSKEKFGNEMIKKIRKDSLA